MSDSIHRNVISPIRKTVVRYEAKGAAFIIAVILILTIFAGKP